MKKLVLQLTKTQVYKIREFVSKNGYPEGCVLEGKYYYLLAQPVVKDFNTRLDVILFTEKQGDKINKLFKKIKIIS